MFLEHLQQMWDMCQMLNIWHISHTKHHLTPFIRCSKCHIFCNMLQYRCKFAMVRNQNGISFNNFLFSFLSPLSSLYSFLFSLTGSLSSQPSIPSILSFPFNLRSVWRWPLSPEAQAAWATSSPLTAHEPSSSPTSKMRRAIVIVTTSSSSLSDLANLSLFFGGCGLWRLICGCELLLMVMIGRI